ncbi:hypothetical protein LTR97_007064 [Elasticomyces elasticus]|uniref:Uncharacterized protein n=1 Tax=Elasticomyces elasticus TaxID=574655 RepID=A0AAN7ZTM7_9PEZI|nr:hypothetical protein LTR97_007064 [Elasticomyces elasticus]
MASKEEWQVIRPRDNNHQKAVKELTVSSKTSTRVESDRDTASQSKANSLWQKLPGEIRNQIYELLSAPSPSDSTSSNCVRFGSWHPASKDQEKYHRFEEPGLLKAAKWIRLEARQIYFQTPIEIAVTTSDIAPACEWLRTIAASNVKQDKSLGQITLWLTDGNWDDIESWLPLAALVREYRFGPFLKAYEEEDASQQSEYCIEIMQAHSWHHRFVAALKEVIALGIKAREHSWSNGELEVAYWKWMEAQANMMTTKKSRRQRRATAWAAGASRRQYIYLPRSWSKRDMSESAARSQLISEAQ